jgi:hypothetical protein
MTEKQSTGIKGGKRPGAGRKKGIPNKRTAEVQKAVEASGVTPLEFMLNLMRRETAHEDPKVEIAREALAFEAAKAAAPYVHARLASVELKGSMKVTKTDLSDDDLAAIATRRGA